MVLGKWKSIRYRFIILFMKCHWQFVVTSSLLHLSVKTAGKTTTTTNCNVSYRRRCKKHNHYQYQQQQQQQQATPPKSKYIEVNKQVKRSTVFTQFPQPLFNCKQFLYCNHFEIPDFKHLISPTPERPRKQVSPHMHVTTHARIYTYNFEIPM